MDKSRQQFEEYMRTRFPDVNGFTNYVAYLVWQASRESLEVELPHGHEEDDEYDYFAMGYNSAIDKCKQILINNGLKIKC